MLVQAEDIEYIIDENKVGSPYPVRVFDIEKFGIQKSTFLRFVSSQCRDLSFDSMDVRSLQYAFLKNHLPDHHILSKREVGVNIFRYTNLEWQVIINPVNSLSKEDRSKFNLIKPYRRRGIAKFILHNSQNVWISKRLQMSGFSQSASEYDFRVATRVFDPLPEELTLHKDFIKLLSSIAEMVESVETKRVLSMEIIVHWMGVTAHRGWVADNSPEGIHRDGSQYIVSALVIDRKNIKGGVSRVFDPEKNLMFKHQLESGQGIFQEDQNLWHDITNFSVKDVEGESQRNVLGFDIINIQYNN